MIELAGERIFYVDFHCQWWHKECPGLFLAGLSYYGFDAALMVLPVCHNCMEKAIKESGACLLPIRGREHMFSWAHFVTWGCEEDVSSDKSNIRETLLAFKEKSRLVIFAHPCHPPTRKFLWDNGKIDSLLEEGLIDAVELVNAGNYRRDPELIEWYEKESSKGRSIPITGGCDVHHLLADTRPACVYSDDFPPEKDIDAVATLRTLVLAEECKEEAILDAVKNCRVVIETEGKLIGPEKIVEKLLKAGYWDTSRRELQRQRELSPLLNNALLSNQVCQVELKKPLSNSRFTINGNRLPIFGNSLEFKAPDIDNADDHWSPVTVSDSQGYAHTSALHIIHPIELDIFGCRNPEDLKPRVCVVVNNRKPEYVNGNIILVDEENGGQQGNSFKGLAPGAKYSCLLPLEEIKHLDVAHKFKTIVKFDAGDSRTASEDLTFVGCHHSTHLDWSKAEEIAIDRSELVASGNWDGVKDSSAAIRLLWNDAGVHIQACVQDDIHCQPRHGEGLYQGDSIQIGIEPLYERLLTPSSAYEFQTGLTETGPELFCSGVPAIYNSDVIPESNTYLPDSCANIQKIPEGLLYELHFPWQWLSPMKPNSGNIFGLFILLFDNDGQKVETISGCKSIMTWPHMKLCGWKRPRYWAPITLL